MSATVSIRRQGGRAGAEARNLHGPCQLFRRDRSEREAPHGVAWSAILQRMAHGMVFLGFGKYVRADRIYALEPIVGNERGSGSRTLVWVEGIPDPVVASRTQHTILEEIEASTVRASGRPRSGRGSLTRHPQLFEGE